MKTSKHMWTRILSVLLVLVMVSAFILPNIHVSAADTDADLWIDPVNGNDANDGTTETTALKTIQAAKTKAAELSADSDVVVILKSGTYDASETIVFGETDSGKNGHTITYRAASGATPIISGGTSLDGWTLHDAEKNIYVTDIPKGTELARSFYVDGKVQTMAYIEQSPIDWQVLNTSGYRSPYVESADNHEYLIMDLGADKLVSGITLYAGSERAQDGNAAAFPKDFTIQVSADGIKWTTVATETDAEAPIARSGKQFLFTTVAARYVKLDVTELGNAPRNTTGKYHLALSEILVGVSGKESTINLNLVQHLDLETPILSASKMLSSGTSTVIELGGTVAVGGIAVNGSDVDGTRGNIKVEATADGETWTTVLEKKNYLLDGVNDLAFNTTVASALRITASFDAGVNVKVYAPMALTATGVTAHGQNGDKLTDGDFTSVYQGPSFMTSVAGNSDIIIDLGSIQDIGALRLYPVYENGKTSGHLKAARILTSKDGETWTTALELADITAPEFGAQLLLLNKGVKAQYIKIQPLLLTSVGNDYRLQLAEVEIVPTKVEVNENEGPQIGYKNVYTPVSLGGATPHLGYYENVNDLSGTPIAFQREDVTTPGEEAACIIDKKANSHGWSGLFNMGNLVAHGGVKVPAFYLDLGTATPINTIDIVMDKDIWGSPRDYAVQVYDGTEWITVAEETDVIWTSQSYAIHTEFETVSATAARILVYDLYMPDGTYPEDADTNAALYNTRFILNEFNPQLMTQVPYEIEVNTDADTVEYNEITLTKDNVVGLGYYRGSDRTEINPYYTGYNNDTNGLLMKNAAAAIFDGNEETYGGAGAQQYQWIPPVGANVPALLVDPSLSNGGNPVLINAIELVVREDGRNAPYDYVIEVNTSATGDNWVTVAEEVEKDWSIGNKVTYKFPAMEIYQVRLVSTFTTPDANIPLENCYGSVYTSLQLAELSLLNINDPTNPVAENLCTQGDKASGDQNYTVHLIEAKNDNSENKYNANKAIDGFIDPAEQIGFVVPEKYNFKDLMNPENVEMNTLYLWYHNMQHFTGISGDGTEIYLDTSLMPTWIANDYLFIDSVGEWYIDRDNLKIYYKADGTMTGKEAILPVAEQIITMEYASNIKFEGITFSHTTWTHPSEYEYNDQQANTYFEDNKWKQVPAGILLNGCESIVFDDCDITNMGTAGIKIKSDGNKQSDGNQVINSRIYEVGYSGIIVGEVYGHHGYQSHMLVKNTTIKNNYVTRVGVDNRDSPGIVACYTNGTIIEHNEIAYMPYTGISTGWGWDTEEFGGGGSAPNDAFLAEVGNNKVIYNYVHDTGKNNRDGGSIYNLGASKGSEVAYNYIINSWDGDDVYENGLYMDQGSAWIEVHHNVVGENVGYWMHQWMYTIHDNYWHDNYYVKTKSRDNGTNNRAENNHEYADQAELMTEAAAVEIMNNAGLLDESVKGDLEEGFFHTHDIIQEFWPGKNSRYIEPNWGWSDVAINGQVGQTSYDSIKKTVSINVKEDADITSLALMFKLDDGWTCDKVSGATQDFTNPVVYTLTNGSEIIEWTVTVRQQKDSGGEIPGEEINLGDIIANHQPGQWTVDPHIVGGVMHHSAYSGYIEQYFGDQTIFLFDMQIDIQGSEFAAISLNNQDPTLDWNSGSTEYFINFNANDIEVQKFVGGARTVFFGEVAQHNAIYGTLPNNFFTPDEVHSIKCGAINTDDGNVRLFLYIDGNLVFDIIDNEDPIRDGGHFAVYAESQTISLRGYTDKQNTPDRTELDWALYVIDSLDVRDYKQETWGNLQDAIVTVNELLGAFGGVTQATVDHCTLILWDALDGLEQVDGTSGAIIPDRPVEPGELDWSKYNSVYNLLLSLDLYAYTPESMTELFTAIDKVNVIMAKEEVTQEEIDEATALLTSGIKALKAVNGGYVVPAYRPDGLDYTLMDAAMSVACSALESNYSAATFAALQDAIFNAYAAMTDENATQTDINNAYIALVNAIKALEYTGAGLQPIVPPVRVPEQDGGNEGGNTGNNGGSTTDPDQPGKEDSDTPAGDGDDTPNGKTGDDFMMTTWIILLSIGVIGAAAVVILLKKNGNR